MKNHQRSLTEILAKEVAETPTAEIPDATISAIKRLAVDHIGIAYMGAALSGTGLHSYALGLGGRPDAILIGTGKHVPAELAAGFNTQFCHVTDFQETGPGLHVGALCFHTAFAVGQRVGASGDLRPENWSRMNERVRLI